jgi:hypothetical protein
MGSDQAEGLADTDDGGDHAHHSDPGSLSGRLVDVVVRHEDVQNIPDDLHPLALQDLRPALHIQRFSLVLALQEDDGHLGQVPQDSEDVLEEVGPQTAGVVDGHGVLTDDFEFSEEDAVVAEEEEDGAEVLEDGEELHGDCSGGLLLEQQRHVLADLRGVLQRAQETQDLARAAHLDVDVVGGGLGGMVLGVDGGVLHQPQDLRGEGSTLSLLSVLLSRSRKVFRYCIKVD